MTKKLAMTVGTARRAVRNLALLAAVAVAFGAWAATETVGGYTWAYINGDTVEIDRCIHSVAGGNTIEWFVATNFYNLKKSL